MLHKFVPWLRAQVRPHAGRGASQGRSQVRSSAAQAWARWPRCWRRFFEGAWRAVGGLGEAVGEARTESLLGDVGEAVVGVAGESSRSGVGTPGGGVAHRGRLLEGDADAATSGVFDGLLVLVVELVVLQAVTERSQGGEMGAGAHAPPTRPTGGPDVAAVHAAHDGGAASRGCGMEKGCVCACERV